jgi:hypothetical protein
MPHEAVTFCAIYALPQVNLRHCRPQNGSHASFYILIPRR